MQQQRLDILDIIKKNPKHYIRIIKKNDVLVKWIDKNSLIETTEFKDKIYSAIYQESNLCEFGNIKKISRFNSGWTMCGPANVCQCTKNNIKFNVSKTKLNYSDDQNSKINEKRLNSMVLKYGVGYNSQRPEIHHSWTKPKIPLNVFNKLNDKIWLTEEYEVKKRTTVDIAKELNTYYGTVIDYLKLYGFEIRQTSNYSIIEKDIGTYIKSLGVSIEESNWKILKNKEIDIYIPSSKLAIEINGLYWHSAPSSELESDYKNKHLDKTIECEKYGIQLLHITDFEWINKAEIIKDLIKSKLGLTNKIYARKCQVRSLTNKETRKFLIDNHIQGYIRSTIAYGLFLDQELVMMIGFGKNRFKKNNNLEILRISTKIGYTVVGGLSKLISHTKKYHSGLFITYCDRSKSIGNGYLASGFKLIGNSKPGYFWTDGTKVISRYKAQKKQLSKWLKSYDSKLSESKNMFNSGYRRYWDCGNLIFEI